jgi:hypothetical protein
MKYELVNKTTNEVVDTKDLSDIWLNGAKTFFREQKRLDDTSFDELFEVRQKKEPTLNRRTYKWWKEESTKLEDF